MGKYAIVFLAAISLASCSKSGEGDSSGADVNIDNKPTSISVVQAQKEEISEINKVLNKSDQYSLSAEEIQTLFDEGAINDSEKEELLALIK